MRRPKILTGTCCAILRGKGRELNASSVETLVMGISFKREEIFLTLDVLKSNYKQLKKRKLELGHE